MQWLVNRVELCAVSGVELQINTTLQFKIEDILTLIPICTVNIIFVKKTVYDFRKSQQNI